MPNIYGIYSFFWEGYSYVITKTNSINYTLIMHVGTLLDKYTKIEKSVTGSDKILNFLQLRCIPLVNYLEIEKIFIDEET